MKDDTISRQAAIDAINEIINRFERILQGIRESKVDDSVCGMCEYDGAYIGQSGDWCNECPGFEKNNCFKLSDKCRTRWLKSVELPSAQPDPEWIPVSERLPEKNEYVLLCNKELEPYEEAGYSRMAVGWLEDGKFCCWDDRVARKEFVAWMPLPGPYKEGEQDD